MQGRAFRPATRGSDPDIVLAVEPCAVPAASPAGRSARPDVIRTLASWERRRMGYQKTSPAPQDAVGTIGMAASALTQAGFRIVTQTPTSLEAAGRSPTLRD